MRTGFRIPALLALALAAFGSWWWLGEQRESVGQTAVVRHPDSYFKQSEVLRHDATGQPELQVKATYAEHFENEPWVHLREMVAEGVAEGPAWRLTADEGRLTDDGIHLEARGDVRLSRRGDGEGQMQLRSETLSVNTETQVARTTDQVTIVQGSGEITGRGLWASLADDRLRIESNVEARYGK